MVVRGHHARAWGTPARDRSWAALIRRMLLYGARLEIATSAEENKSAASALVRALPRASSDSGQLKVAQIAAPLEEVALMQQERTICGLYTLPEGPHGELRGKILLPRLNRPHLHLAWI